MKDEGFVEAEENSEGQSFQKPSRTSAIHLNKTGGKELFAEE